MRLKYSSGTVWEERMAYSRAVRIGNIIEVAGTTAVDDQGRVMGLTAYEQSRFIFQKIGVALEACGSSLEDVVRTRMYLTDISRWEEVGRAHAEVFQDIKPVATLVGTSGLLKPQLLVEIEVTAHITED